MTGRRALIGQARIGRVRVSVAGAVDPAVARDAVERAFALLAESGVLGHGHLTGLRVDVRVPHRDEHQMAEAIAAAIDAAVRREAGR